MSMRFSIDRDDPGGEAAVQLMRDLSEEESRRYHDIGADGSDNFVPEQALLPRGAFVIARVDDRPVGCGALRPMDGDVVAEIKRMFVNPDVRRQGIGRAILAELERLAAEFGYRAIRLETGDRQPEAIALYERSDFHRIPQYGEHVGDPVSVCFEKKVVK